MESPSEKVYTCPACGSEALAGAGKTDGLKNPGFCFACFSCGRTWREGELNYCPQCGRPVPSDELEELIICRSAVGFYVCKNCYEKIR